MRTVTLRAWVARGVRVDAPGEVSPRVQALLRGPVGGMTRALFRPTLEGEAHLPAQGPYLLVANHSAGVGLAELLCLAVLWTERFAGARPLAGFALPLGFKVWPLSALHRHLGSVPATQDAAREALRAGVPLLVFPGGDHESLKPFWQNDRVDFGGRVGYLRLASELRVPVVPLGIRNGALTAPMLMRARWLAWACVWPRLVGQKRWGVSLLGALGAVAILECAPLELTMRAALAWLWLGSPLSFAPWVPARLRLRIGPPLDPRALAPQVPTTDDLRRASVEVERAVEALVRAP